MNRKIILPSILAIVLLVAIIAAEQLLDGKTETKAYEQTVIAMDTVMTVKAYGENAEAGINLAIQEIMRLEKLLSTTMEESEIYKINHADGEPVKISEETARLIKEAIEISRLTDGALDITVYPIVLSWGFTGSEFRVPGDGEIKESLRLVDYKGIRIDGDSVTLNKGQMIDLGAIAKGYAADRVRDKLKEAGVDSALINLGGNILTMGDKPGNDSWSVGIKDPFSQDKLAGSVEIGEKAVVTSGNYERFFEQDGKRYWHIIDPKTGYPADNGVASVTIIADSSVYADALSTALFVMGPEEALRAYNNLGNFEYILITSAGETITSGNIEFVTK